MSKYSKSIAAFIASAIPAVTVALADADKVWALIVPVLTAIVTYLSPANKPAE